MTVETEFLSAQQTIIQRMFIESADENYIIARWACLNGLFTDFYWLGLHAVEKYLKASLLLNGEDSKGGHNIKLMYEKLNKIAKYSDLLPTQFDPKHSSLRDEWFTRECVPCFVCRLNEMGDPNNRYNSFNRQVLKFDLMKLDQLIFNIRRLCLRLDSNCFIGRQPIKSGVPSNNLELLQECPNWMTKLGSKLSPKRLAKNPKLKKAFYKFNFPFAPENYDHGSSKLGGYSYNSALYLSVYEPLKNAESKKQAKIAEKVVNWATKNISMPKDVKKELLTELDNMKERLR